MSRSRAQVFEDIYVHHLWNDKGSRSGRGSDPEATRRIVRPLSEMLDLLEATTLLDVGCGESTWLNREPPGYIGCDIVPQAVKAAQALHGDRKYFVADIVTDPLPRRDVILCRDVLMHLPVEQGVQALENFRRTGALWLIATTFEQGTNDRGIEVGEFYRINMETPPFELVPIASIKDDWKFEDKALMAFHLQDRDPSEAELNRMNYPHYPDV